MSAVMTLTFASTKQESYELLSEDATTDVGYNHFAFCDSTVYHLNRRYDCYEVIAVVCIYVFVSPVLLHTCQQATSI